MHIAKLAVLAFLVLALPLTASAHQHAVFEIGGTTYEFVVGSLGEPIVVDDKTGVDFRVSAGGEPVEGLAESLQVELQAGDKRKVLDLEPMFNTPGSYAAAFYPTVATTLSYRFFGEINGTPIDLTFTCRAEGAEGADEGEREISDVVTQISISGGFGCPAEKAALGFPEESASLVDIADDANGESAMSITGFALAAAALAFAIPAFARRKD